MTAHDRLGDAELLGAYIAGDAQAFARLYDRHDRPSFLFVRRILGSAAAAAAEDVHQEIWLTIARAAGGFDPARGSFAAWLYTIARRKALDEFRRRKVIPLNAQVEEAVNLIPDPEPSPLERIQTRELAQQVVAAVEALPLEQRGAFLMFAEAGLSLEEVAHATGVPVETAKSRLRYARAKLRQALAGARAIHV